VFLLLSAAAVAAFGGATANFYAAKGLLVHVAPGADGGVLANLQRVSGLPRAAVEATLAAYARNVDGVADAFGKRVFPVARSYDVAAVQREGLWVGVVTPALHYRYVGMRAWSVSPVFFCFCCTGGRWMRGGCGPWWMSHAVCRNTH